jgi:hypothetical protein
MNAADLSAARANFTHDHPLMILAISTGISLAIVSVIVLIRWGMSSGAWKYHPGGARGFLWDEFLRLGVIYLPFLMLGLIFKSYVYELHPELNTSNTWAIFGAVFLVSRMITRRLPIVKAVGRHLDAARAQQRQATAGGAAAQPVTQAQP